LTRKSEVAFTSDSKSQSVTGTFTSLSSSPSPSNPETTYLSGAIEPVLARCKTYLRHDNSLAPLEEGVAKLINSKVIELASQGLRVVAMAFGPPSDPDGLTFAGFQGMMDPPRPGVADAIAQLASGGIHVVMITGDSEQTAVAIARQLGIRTTGGGGGGGGGGRQGVLTGKEIDLLSQRQLTDRIGGVTVFARTTPRHKMAIIEAYQSRGAVVAMTGDGGASFSPSSPFLPFPRRDADRSLRIRYTVNDAPALKMADIGVSMGRGGTDVAKEAADLILVDDNFATLLPAVEEGKGAFSF
jgi:Ca2+-transporting ATPase